MKTYIKIVQNLGSSNYCSFNYSVGCHSLTYRQGEKTTAPDNTKLFIFDTLKNAEDFIIGHLNQYRYEFWTVSAEQVGKPRYCSKWGMDIANFWKTKKRHKKLDCRHFLGKAPQGTLWCKSLTLIDKIK